MRCAFVQRLQRLAARSRSTRCSACLLVRLILAILDELFGGARASGPESRTLSGIVGLRCRVRKMFRARLLAIVNSQVENLAFG